jgi:DNA modification methylase
MKNPDWQTDDGRVQLFHGDCLEISRSLPDGSIDSLITDPPYCAGAISESRRTSAAGQGLRSENIRRFGWFVGDNMGTAGLSSLLRSIAVEATRLVAVSGSMLVFCDWRMLPALEPSIESAGLRYQGLVVWDKGCMGLGTGFRAQHELILHFTFGSPVYHDKGTGNVIQVARVDTDDREHQTQKPLPLMERLIDVVCPPDGTVLDPFAGSGSTIVSAARCGRRAVGIEKDYKHFCTAVARVEAELERNPLFESTPKVVQRQLLGDDAA